MVSRRAETGQLYFPTHSAAWARRRGHGGAGVQCGTGGRRAAGWSLAAGRVG